MIDKVSQAVMRTIIEEVGNSIKDSIIMDLFEKKILREPAAAHYMNDINVVLCDGQGFRVGDKVQYVKLEERKKKL